MRNRLQTIPCNTFPIGGSLLRIDCKEMGRNIWIRGRIGITLTETSLQRFSVGQIRTRSAAVPAQIRSGQIRSDRLRSGPVRSSGGGPLRTPYVRPAYVSCTSDPNPVAPGFNFSTYYFRIESHWMRTHIHLVLIPILNDQCSKTYAVGFQLNAL